MEITKKDIEHIADLSMLNLSEQEIERYTKDMQDIVSFAEQVNEVDTEGVDISAFALETSNVFRKDEVRESLERESLLQNAPSTNGEAYQIPSMME
ncbi:MAG: Asp-tRNA(Asn)/Glu-tRNA(Gln) amidotransferase subunit GatC [Clostridia bacterium]|mgnify:CR=1 FL=1|nr:Asp-tRNA(Asn)/Glu-tRNA(Gln) amidotransferase subunit GatC [Clostridia bacterium]